MWDSLCLLDLIDYFLFYVGEIFNYNIFKNFLIPFLFLFFFWGPDNLNVGAFDILPEVPESILSSYHSFYFILLFRCYFHHFIFQITDSFLCFRYSVIDSYLDSILKSRDITLPTKVCLIKVMVFPVVMYGCESWTTKKAEHRRIDVFELWCREDS